jgi:hypothetical protein
MTVQEHFEAAAASVFHQLVGGTITFGERASNTSDPHIYRFSGLLAGPVGMYLWKRGYFETLLNYDLSSCL